MKEGFANLEPVKISPTVSEILEYMPDSKVAVLKRTFRKLLLIGFISGALTITLLASIGILILFH